ncbi:MAG: hypothetical protein EBR81_12235 [Proteobacteria bacterium]|nr:hypothetical protein [Pseudomonadota bacterium]
MPAEEDNPSLRQRFGEKVAAKVKAQEQLKKQEADYKAASKFRPRKAERGTIVLIAATKTREAKLGERVGPKYRGKVFAFYITKTGEKKPYRELEFRGVGKPRKAKHKVPVPYRKSTLDPYNFPKRAREKFFFSKLGTPVKKPLIVKAKTGNVAYIEMPNGQVKAISHQDVFGQRKEQEPKPKLYRAFIAKKLYAGIAQKLQQMGLVSQGSATRVGSLPENKDKPREQWMYNGEPWSKRRLETARVAEIQFLPRTVIVTSGTAKKAIKKRKK